MSRGVRVVTTGPTFAVPDSPRPSRMHQAISPPPLTPPPVDLYLDVLKKTLTAAFYPESSWQVVTGFRPGPPSLLGQLRQWIVRQLHRRGLLLVRQKPFDPESRAVGRDWPCFGYSMVGLARMDNLHACIATVLREQIPGDLIETGVWRGGCAILMKAVLARHGVTDRTVWVADSFEGLPSPVHDIDRVHASYDLSGSDYLTVSLEDVRANFDRFGLLDDGVQFLKGWFAETLTSVSLERLAVLRLDGDMYESTRDALGPLYPKVSPGGFVIVDDYNSWPACRRAVDEYREKFAINDPLVGIDDQAVYWRVT
jgi:O-methyltransferase